MSLWTIQPAQVWEHLQRCGTLLVDAGCAHYKDDVPWQYLWLVQQLKTTIPTYSGGLPWWCYCSKPDLRYWRHHAAGRVRIELVPPPGSFTTFPVWAWDLVYSGEYLAYSYEEWRDWQDRLRRAVPDEDTWPLPEPWKTELEASWRRLLGPDLPPTCWLVGMDKEQTDLPWVLGLNGERIAVLERIEMGHVRKVSFLCRSVAHRATGSTRAVGRQNDVPPKSE